MSAQDKGTGKQEKITITNEKGRLSEEEIERMVKEAEEFADSDKEARKKVEARNDLENYCYRVKQTLEDDKGKISDSDKKSMKAAIDSALEWLESNPEAEADEYKERLKEVEEATKPILASMYQNAGGAGGAGGAGADEDMGSHDEL